MKFNFSLKSVTLMTALLCMTSIYTAQANANKTEDFVTKASVSNLFEIESSKVALNKSQNNDIKQFAQHMIDDHTSAGSELESSVREAGIDNTLIRKTLDNKHKKLMDKLQKASQKDFDKQYVNEQMDAHKEAVKLFKDYSDDGDDATIKAFADKTLPVLEQHNQRIKEIKDAM
jgi:putative membrane protein